MLGSLVLLTAIPAPSKISTVVDFNEILRNRPVPAPSKISTVVDDSPSGVS